MKLSIVFQSGRKSIMLMKNLSGFFVATIITMFILTNLIIMQNKRS